MFPGEPTNKAGFNKMLRKVAGADANGTAIESDKPSDWDVTWTKVSAKKDKLEFFRPAFADFIAFLINTGFMFGEAPKFTWNDYHDGKMPLWQTKSDKRRTCTPHPALPKNTRA